MITRMTREFPLMAGGWTCVYCDWPNRPEASVRENPFRFGGPDG